MSKYETSSAQKYIIDNVNSCVSASLAIICNLFRSSVLDINSIRDVIKERLEKLAEPNVLNKTLKIIDELVIMYLKNKIENIFISKYSDIARIVGKILVDKKLIKDENYFETDITLVREICKESPIICTIFPECKEYSVTVEMRFYPRLLFSEGVEAITENMVSLVRVVVKLLLPYDKQSLDEFLNRFNIYEYLVSNQNAIYVLKGRGALKDIHSEKLLEIIRKIRMKEYVEDCIEECRINIREQIKQAIINTAVAVRSTIEKDEIESLLSIYDDVMHQTCVRICEHIS